MYIKISNFHSSINEINLLFKFLLLLISKVHMLGNLMENMLLIKYFFITGKSECVVWNSSGVRDTPSFPATAPWWKTQPISAVRSLTAPLSSPLPHLHPSQAAPPPPQFLDQPSPVSLCTQSYA